MYLIKWDELDYDQCTWEEEKTIKDLPDYQQKLELYSLFNDVEERQAAQKKFRAHQSQKKPFRKYKEQPTCLGGSVLSPKCSQPLHSN